MKRVLTAAVFISLLAVPQSAFGHSLVRPAGSLISYLSQDATSLNTLTVRPNGNRIEFHDPTVDGGIDPGSCAPGEVSGGFVVQVLCPASGVQRLRLDLGEREDTATVSVPVATTILGGNGADGLTAGPAGDQVSAGDGDDGAYGGEGDDAIDGGLGVDILGGGPGVDQVISRDGLADVVSCGDGADTVDADTVDRIEPDCESVTRTETAAPTGVDKPGRPVVDVGGETIQRPGASRRVRVYATSSEPGKISASGFLDIAGLSVPLKSRGSERVRVGGGGVRLTYEIKRNRWQQVRRALRRNRKVFVRLGVVATDLAGNSRKEKAPPIRIAARRGGARAAATTSRAAGEMPPPSIPPASARHPEPGDVDGDEVPDALDNCPTIKNGSQENTDKGYTPTDPPPPPADGPPPGSMSAGDDAGDACDADDDADGINDFDGSGGRLDNCRIDRNPNQTDTDGDGYGDVCPPVDSDGDGVIEDDDNCDFTPNPDQSDLDGDDTGDACDRDMDGDDFDNQFDNCPTVYNIEPTDVDGDGLINDQLDADGDGIGTACDPDESVIGPPAPPDAKAPKGRIRAARRVSLAQLRAGLIVTTRCSEACAATSEIVLGRRTARRLGLGRRRIVSSGSARLDGAGKTYVFSRLDRRAGKALDRRRAVKAKLVTRVVDESENSRRVQARILVVR